MQLDMNGAGKCQNLVIMVLRFVDRYFINCHSTISEGSISSL